MSRAEQVISALALRHKYLHMNLPKVQCKNGFWVVMGPVVEKWIKAGRIPYVIYQVAVEEPAFLSEEFNSFSAKLRVRNLSKINFSTLSCSYGKLSNKHYRC